MKDKNFGGNDQMPSWFARVPTKAIMDQSLSHADIRVLAAICCYANNQGFAWPNHSTIVKRVRCSQSSIDKAMAKLKKKKHIEVVSRHRSHPKWRRVMGNVYRIIHDEELPTDKLIDQMNMNDEPPTLKEIHQDAEIQPVSNHNKVEEEKVLVEAVRVARAYAAAAEKSHGQIRQVDDRAVQAARVLIEGGVDGDRIIELAGIELMKRRELRQDAPHHLGVAGIAINA